MVMAGSYYSSVLLGLAHLGVTSLTGLEGHCWDLFHGDALAFFLQPSLHAGNVEHASIARGIFSGIALILLALMFWKRNDKKTARWLLMACFSLLILKLSIFAYDSYDSTADLFIGGIILFSLCVPFWKTHDKYQHRALLVSLSGLFVVFPAYIFGVGYLLLLIIPQVGEDVFLGIMVVGAVVLIIGLASLAGRVGRGSLTADRKVSAQIQS